jgi:transposase
MATGSVRWLRSWGEVVAIGGEGTGSCGAGLARHLTAAGVDVREVMRPNRQHGAATASPMRPTRSARRGPCWPVKRSGTPKAGTGQVEAIRLLRIARRSAMKART